MPNSTFKSNITRGVNWSDLHGQLKFVYRNWKGEIRDRVVTPIDIYFGEDEWHDGPQWFMRAYDQQKKAPRTFALQDIIGPITHVVVHNNKSKHPDNNERLRKLIEYQKRDAKNTNKLITHDGTVIDND